MSDIQIMDAGYPAGEKYNRLNLVEIARQEGIKPLDAMAKRSLKEARRPTGIEKVFINGQLVVEDGSYLENKKHGSVLRAH